MEKKLLEKLGQVSQDSLEVKQMMLENLQVVVRLGHEPTVSCYIVNPVSKSSMTIRHCFWHSDFVSYPQTSVFP